MGLYLSELINRYSGKEPLISKESYQQFFEKQTSDDQFEERTSEKIYNDEYNFGIFLGFSAKNYLGPIGGDPGVSTFMFFNAKNKIGRFLMINTSLTSREGGKRFLWNLGSIGKVSG
jgi:hypothetical protein